MPEMRSVTQQIDGLEEVAALVPKARLELGRGDVPALRLGSHEIVFAVGGYDLWVDGHLRETDLTATGAAAQLEQVASKRSERAREIRETLRNWGKYGPHFDESGRWIGSWWERFPVDEMTDEQVIELARAIAREKGDE